MMQCTSEYRRHWFAVLASCAMLLGLSMQPVRAQDLVPVGATGDWVILADQDCLHAGGYPAYCLVKINIRNIAEYKMSARDMGLHPAPGPNRPATPETNGNPVVWK